MPPITQVSVWTKNKASRNNFEDGFKGEICVADFLEIVSENKIIGENQRLIDSILKIVKYETY